ncbi:chlorophyll synthesis pathway protein BchC [Ectothiorhodospira mobilis]|uniref:chlorophyll synthesis pathway protein BchC n=1 Tax=Ectothiorhodospira mobilis TaxID=195064 RepID=UPI001905E009|nr:chlorophyll synthesis pathway protein BchC [Ectothiorhodospira mobilis]MBK1690665.1 chlorophyll synthesis pathway protein BchC [Ectothiorhodospira mobilis]
MKATAVVIEKPEQLVVSELELTAPGDADVVVDILWSGISTGTERLLWTGRMPDFPGMGYPLVPGYESVGRIAAAGPDSGRREGERVFVPGAACYGEVRGLFGGAASRVVVPGAKVVPLPEGLEEEGVLLALAATAYHAIFQGQPPQDHLLPELIIGHGVLGRLLARIAVATGGSPVVWEVNEARREGNEGYQVVHPDQDTRQDYGRIIDVSGDAGLLDTLIARLGRGGELVLAGFYSQPLSFAFPPAFMREARLRCAAEWQPGDLTEINNLIGSGRVSLHGLITHRHPVSEAQQAYQTAFGEPRCLKMILDWRSGQ